MTAPRRLFSLLTMILTAAATLAGAGAPARAAAPAAAPKPGSLAAPIVRQDVLHDVSAPLADIPPIRPPGEAGEFEPERPEVPDLGPQPADPVRQSSTPTGAAMPAPNLTFEAQRDADNFPFLVEPPDPNIDVGPNNVVQMVNITMAVYDKQGGLQFGPANINTMWQDFGVGSGDPVTPVCAAENNGDPVVQYDQLSDRWMISQFAFPSTVLGPPAPPFYECIAVSQTGDPLGAWNRYEFLISARMFDDYPHFGVWPDAYYMSINQFDVTSGYDFAGPGAVAFERDKMLAGESARMVYFDLSSLGTAFGGQLPSDLDGATLPPAGAPNVFAEADDDASGAFATDRLSLFDFHVDWTDPTLSTFTGPTAVDVAPFDSVFPCTDADGDGVARNCIPEKEGPGLDSISDRLMYRLAYRNFGDHQTLVANHTVDVNDPEGHGGIRWYELRSAGGGPWGVYQQGTYAPDALHRWMGSAAMDRAGDLAVGFSISSADTQPSIAYAGRLASDPLGQLAQGEAMMYQGGGSQQVDGAGRWGDYTSLVLDPSNDCTFWYTNEYYETTGSFDWHTRIGSFTFPSCLGKGADLGVTTTVNDPPVRIGDTLTYTVTVANNGPSGARAAQLVDVLPAEATFVSASVGRGRCTGTSTVSCRLGYLAVGRSVPVTIVATAPSSAATLVNTATASSMKPDPNPDNNVSTTTISVIDTCNLPGVLVSTDTADDPPNASPVPETDLKSLYAAEPHQDDAVARLVFTMYVGTGSPTLPPNSQWYVMWNRPTPDADFDRNYVAMKTNAAGVPSFEYGQISPPSANLPTRLGDADAGSYDPVTGAIQITISTDKIEGVGPGSVLPALQARTFLARADGGPVSQLQATDFGPIEVYRVAGNC